MIRRKTRSRKVIIDLAASIRLLPLINVVFPFAIFSGESNWWNDPRVSTVEILDFEKVSDYYPDDEAIWRIKRTENIDGKDESNAKIFRGAGFYFGQQTSNELQNDRGKRTRRSFVANTNYTNNQTDISENIRRYQNARIKNVPINLTASANSEGIDVKSRSDYLNNGSVHISSKMNVLRSRNFFSNDNSIKLTAVPETDNGKIINSDLRCPIYFEPCLNNCSVDESLRLVEINPRTNSQERVVTDDDDVFSETTSSELGSRYSASGPVSISIYRAVEERTSSIDFGRDVPVSNATIISTRSLKINADDSRKFAKNQSGEDGVATRKISRLERTDEGQSKGAGVEFPRGNTSRGFVTNESRSRVVETTATEKENEAGNGTGRKENREPILGVITVFEPRGRPYQKQETARLSRRMEKDGGKVRASNVGESRNANATRRDSASDPPIDPVVTVAKPETENIINTCETCDDESITPKNNRRENTTSIIVDNDLRKQQQMVSPPRAESRNANKSNGNSDISRIDIRAPGSNGNETADVKEGARTVIEATEYVESDNNNNLRRKLLWIATTFVETEEDPSANNTKSVLNSSIEIDRIGNSFISDENRHENKTINSSNFKFLSRVKRDDNVEDNSSAPQSALINSDGNHARYKRQSTYSDENVEVSNEVGSPNAAVRKEASENNDNKQEEDDENYQNVEGLKKDYNNGEEDVIEGTTR